MIFSNFFSIFFIFCRSFVPALNLGIYLFLLFLMPGIFDIFSSLFPSFIVLVVPPIFFSDPYKSFMLQVNVESFSLRLNHQLH